MAVMKQCKCEIGGDCTKISLCAMTNMQDEYNQLLTRIEVQVNRLEALITNKIYRPRYLYTDYIQALLDHIDETKLILKERY